MFVQRQTVLIIFMTINTLDVPLLEISVFSVAVFVAKKSIAVATVVAIKQLLHQLVAASKSMTKFLELFAEFLVSMTRMQDFLL